MSRRAQYAINASSKYVAADRCLFGADDPDPGRQFTGPKGIETQMGRRMGVRNRHYSWNASVATIGQRWRDDSRGGSVPMVSLGGQGYSMSLVREIAAGRHDVYWRSLFSAISGTPGLFRPWMEMNGSHNPYSGDPAAWKAMWTHVRALAGSVAGLDVKWIFCPQAADPQQVWPDYWPGDAQVDWMGVDLYRHVWSFADPWRKWAILHRKPFSVCESGFEQGATVRDTARGMTLDKDGSKTGHSLIEDTRASIKAHANTVMYLVWNSIGPVGNDFIDTSRLALDQYRNFAHDPYFQFGS
jgi:hypothetical protein